MIRDSYVLFVGLFLLEGKMHMIMTESEVFEFIEEEDVKFIRLAFVDVYGNQKNVSIMPMQLKKAIDVGIPIDSSMITGFDSYFDDLLLVPDLNTLSLLPWRPQRGRVIRFFLSQLSHKYSAIILFRSPNLSKAPPLIREIVACLPHFTFDKKS